MTLSDQDKTYAYDPIGNRLTATEAGTGTTYAANALNQYATVNAGTAKSLLDDGDGNLLDDGDKLYAWDAENRLLAVTPKSPATGSLQGEYAYDWRSRRIVRKVYEYASTWNLKETHGYAYHEWNLLEESVTDAGTSATETKRYVWGMDLSGNLHGAGGVGGLLAMESSTGRRFYAYDGNGNVRALVKADTVNPAASAITARYAYDGFGREVSSVGADAALNEMRFSTKPLDKESDMNYYGYRYYVSDAGRWINRDPIAEEGGDNLYGMVDNDVIFYYDIVGLSSRSKGSNGNGGGGAFGQSDGQKTTGDRGGPVYPNGSGGALPGNSTDGVGQGTHPAGGIADGLDQAGNAALYLIQNRILGQISDFIKNNDCTKAVANGDAKNCGCCYMRIVVRYSNRAYTTRPWFGNSTWHSPSGYIIGISDKYAIYSKSPCAPKDPNRTEMFDSNTDTSIYLDTQTKM